MLLTEVHPGEVYRWLFVDSWIAMVPSSTVWVVCRRRSDDETKPCISGSNYLLKWETSRKETGVMFGIAFTGALLTVQAEAAQNPRPNMMVTTLSG